MAHNCKITSINICYIYKYMPVLYQMLLNSRLSSEKAPNNVVFLLTCRSDCHLAEPLATNRPTLLLKGKVRAKNFCPSPNFSAKALRAFAQLLPPCCYPLSNSSHPAVPLLRSLFYLSLLFKLLKYLKHEIVVVMTEIF